MSYLLHLKRDLWAGALMALLGAGAIREGMRLPVGSLARTGPGFFPIAMGVLLILMGVLIVMSRRQPIAPEDHVRMDLRGGASVVAGVAVFMAMGWAFGFLAAAFSSVFVAALGDRTVRLKEAALVSAGIAVAGGAVFVVLLGVPFPLYHWF